MTDTDEPTRCPRGHLTPSAFEYCTTCGERLTPGGEPEDVGGPSPTPDDEAGAASAVRSRLDALRRKRGDVERRAETPAPPQTPGAPPVLEPPRAIEEPARRFGGLRRKPRAPKAPMTAPGVSLLPDDLTVLPNEPPRTPPPEVEPAKFGESVETSSYPDVEFAIGPGTRSVVAFDRPVAAEAKRTTRRGPEIPTRLLLVTLLAIVLIAAGIIFFVAREPGAPAATLIPPSAAATPTPATSAATATPVAPAAVSEECGNAFAFAAAHAAEAQAPSFQQRTLELCTTSDEWIAAGRLHPAAIGESSASAVDASDLARVCLGAPNAPLCRSTQAASAPPSATASP